MRKLLSAAVLATALLTSTAANAASLLFKFDTANSKIDVLSQGTGFCIACSVSATTTLQEGPFAIDEGTSQTFNFANLNINGFIGFKSNVLLKATLAFVTPDVADATSNGNGFYGTFLGVINGGALSWSAISPITTADGSKFNVAFENLSGINVGTVNQRVTIGVESVAAAVPEPGTWALLIGGFAMMGAMLRRRRQMGVAVAA